MVKTACSNCSRPMDSCGYSPRSQWALK
jgi:hypothetical protein